MLVRVLHITFRYGRDVYGGAELYFMKLTENLYKKGLTITVCTTKSNSLVPFIKSGTVWNNELTDETINGIDVLRFPVKNPNKHLSHAYEKLIQHRTDNEEQYFINHISELAAKHSNSCDNILSAGWHSLERYGSFQMRWTKKQSDVIIKDCNIQEISFLMKNDRHIYAEAIIETQNYRSINPLPISSDWSKVTIPLPDVSGILRMSFVVDRVWRPIRDNRSLGVSISEISYRTDKYENLLDMEKDYKSLFKSKDIYTDHLVSIASKRPTIYCNLFDYLRGPRSPRMVKWLENNIKYSMIAKKHGIPLVLLPLMHVDDEFYHWPHYYRFLRDADMVLAISRYSKQNFFDKIGANSTFVGAGIDTSIFLDNNVNGNSFREKYSLNNKNIILTVSRKTPSKRYDLLIQAVSIIKNNVKDAHLVMIGPDEDNIPINSSFVTYLGKVSDEDLASAYDACDVFAMMSESESFGMVYCEAWSRKKPVIGNLYCGAVASLIHNGVDGYLCKDAYDVANKIELLIQDSQLAKSLGDAGYKKVIENYTWEIVSEKIYNIYKRILD